MRLGSQSKDGGREAGLCNFNLESVVLIGRVE